MSPEEVIEAFQAGGVRLRLTPDRTLHWSSPRYPTNSDGSVNKQAVIELLRQEQAVIDLLAERGAWVDPSKEDDVADPTGEQVGATERGVVWPPITFMTRFSPAGLDGARQMFLNPTETERVVAGLLSIVGGRLVHLYWLVDEGTPELLAIYELPRERSADEIAQAVHQGGFLDVKSTTRLRTSEALRIGQAMAAGDL